MDLTTLLALLAGGFGVVMGGSPLLQAIRTHKRQSSADISIPFLAILVIGGSLWLSYGLAIGNIAVIVANSVGVLSSVSALAVSLYWREK